MAFLNFIDVSRWQGDIDWNAVQDSGVQGAIIKIGGGDDGLYFDSKANANYYAAKAAGLLIGGYWFAGGTDPIAEADKFVQGMSPLEENDNLALDWEISHPDPIGWCQQFVQRVHDQTNVWVEIYVNGSTRNAYDWNAGCLANCAKWIAWYGKDPNGDLPVNGVYVMHQYTSTGRVNGISGNVDEDAVFMTPEQWDAYGWHAQTPDPIPVSPTPEPTPQPTPAPQPAPTPGTPTPDPDPTPVINPPSTQPSLGDFLKAIWGLIKKLFRR